MLAQHQPVIRPADVLGAHDLISLPVLDDAVLVNACLVRKGIGAHHGLVGLHRETGDVGDQLGTADDLGGIQTGFTLEVVFAGAHRHYYLFQGRVAGAFSQAVNSAFHLPGAMPDRRQGIGDRQPQVVVAMHREHRLVRVRRPLNDIPDSLTELLRHTVAHRIRDIDGAGAGCDDGFDDTAQEIQLRAPGVLR